MNYELFRTPVEIAKPPFGIKPGQHILCVGSCFAQNIGQRFTDALFPTAVNPWGVMYNPVSILHTIQRIGSEYSQQPDKAINSPSSAGEGLAAAMPPDVAILTLGTNHVYRLKSTGEIVDNCQKRPANLFQEECLSVEQCVEALCQCVGILQQLNPEVKIVFTVSPIRYQKYGFHESQLSKATLLLAADKVVGQLQNADNAPHENGGIGSRIAYFPAYELLNDELRDYRFYASDMLHPSEQAVGYVWQRFVEAFFTTEACQYLKEWKPIRQALDHRPFHPDAPAYQQFMALTQQRLDAFKAKYSL